MNVRGWLTLSMLVLTIGCVTTQDVPTIPPVQVAPALNAERVAAALPSELADRSGWAQDILATLEILDLPRDVKTVAAVMAVLEQESGFNPNPTVPGLNKLVRERMDKYASKLGPLGPPLMEKLLEGKAPGQSRSFYQRIDLLKTEQDLDRLFRDILTYYSDKFPVSFATANLLGEAFTARGFEDLNPITTAGSMQVSVRYAMQVARDHGKDPNQVREEIYTRRGGLYYGVSRLLGYEAGYNKPIYRFADYNAGFFASRNAALQAQLGRLVGQELIPDGDLLLYDKEGRALERDSNTLKALLSFRARFAPQLTDGQVRRDASKEKLLELEQTELYKAIKSQYQKQFQETPDYAHLPRVTISSPKLKSDKSTAWFARAVNARYQKFYDRLVKSLSQS